MKELVALSVVLLLFLPSCADGQPDEQLSCNEVKAREFKTLGFKGLHLGMTVEEVDDLVRCTSLEYDPLSYKSGDPDVMPPVELVVFLNPDKSPGSSVRERVVGCREDGAGQKCYEFRTIAVAYVKGKLVAVSIFSPDDDSREFVVDWASFILDELTGKYGEPSEIYNRITDIDESLFENKSDGYIAMWGLGEESVELGVKFNRHGYGVIVVLLSDEAKKKSLFGP
ncbi:MAG: hypothetical protein V3W31_07920 [Thermodesulfobacteriota bacterium]